VSKTWSFFAILRVVNNNLRSFFSGSIFDKVLYKYPKGPFLEIGCGRHPILPELLAFLGKVDCLDHSKEAIAYCRKNFKEGEFLEADILDFKASETYGQILDGHLLHCLNSLEDYEVALKNIFYSLKRGGTFYLETMISHSEMSFEAGFFYKKEQYQLLKGSRVSRMILSSIKVEELFKMTGFEILLFKVNEDLRMIPHDARENPYREDPQVLRLIASRPASL